MDNPNRMASLPKFLSVPLALGEAEVAGQDLGLAGERVFLLDCLAHP